MSFCEPVASSWVLLIHLDVSRSSSGQPLVVLVSEVPETAAWGRFLSVSNRFLGNACWL
jgi:hypothetical protein